MQIRQQHILLEPLKHFLFVFYCVVVAVIADPYRSDSYIFDSLRYFGVESDIRSVRNDAEERSSVPHKVLIFFVGFQNLVFVTKLPSFREEVRLQSLRQNLVSSRHRMHDRCQYDTFKRFICSD